MACIWKKRENIRKEKGLASYRELYYDRVDVSENITKNLPEIDLNFL